MLELMVVNGRNPSPVSGALAASSEGCGQQVGAGYRIDGFGAFIPPMKQRSEKR
jgi:hypothetical protein